MLAARIAVVLLLSLPCYSQEKERPSGTSPGESPKDRVLVRINEYRKLAGLRPVTEDPKLSEGCQLHAEYLRQNPDIAGGSAAHTEDEIRRGYSEAGKKAAARSLIGQGAPLKDPAWVVDNLMSTLYHRIPFLAPHLLTVGIGCAQFKETGHVIVVDATNTVFGNGEVRDPVVFPTPNQKDVPLLFANGLEEWPNPIPEKGAKAGYPITVSVAPNAWQPGEAVMSLADDRGPVDCWYSSPEKPALKERAQRGVFCLIPRQALKPSTAYTVAFKCKKLGVEKTPEWSKTWTFTTAGQ